MSTFKISCRLYFEYLIHLRKNKKIKTFFEKNPRTKHTIFELKNNKRQGISYGGISKLPNAKKKKPQRSSFKIVTCENFQGKKCYFTR